jgi:glycosyltransferase involved in cell wall biosynthesis
MKVLHCISTANIGGIERLVIELAIEQKNQGLNVTIMLDRKDGHYYEYLLSEKIPVIISNIKDGYDINFKTYYNLKNKFREYQIIHLHSFSLIKTLASINSKTKVVYTIHGISKGVRKENPIKFFLREFLKKQLLNKINFLISNSIHTLNTAKLHYGFEKTRNQVIYNGIRITKDLPHYEYKINSEQLTVGLISRFTDRKRIDRLLKAFYLFRKNTNNGKLILVGDGQSYNLIKEQINALALDNYVEMVGYSNSVDNYYKQFDVFVQPSDNEGFGLVAVEAYLHGLPVLVFKDSGGLQEIVSKIEPDKIVETEEELANLLIWCSKNKEQLKASAKDRINYAIAYYSIQRMEREYHKIYLDTLTND